MPGALVLIGTPIGNLGDLSPRAVEELARADVVACEDSRRTGRLLQHAGVSARALLVVNDHNEAQRVGDVLTRLARGERVAVVTDAGMPGISDPGERLVRAAARDGHTIEVVPGPSAAIAALVASGLPTARFVFEGFLSRKAGARRQRLAELVDDERTLVFYEAPHRLAATLTDLCAVLGAWRRVAVARELTKLHEEIWRGHLNEAAAWAAETPPRGEIALVVQGALPPGPADEADVEAAVQARLDAGDSARDAATTVAADLGVPKRQAYAVANRLT
ncbi:MAG: 16S rRNA (cytidine(1402)-2'-O)-methyltransferase [Acidimicrobiales bacterium]